MTKTASDATGALSDGRRAWQTTYRVRFDEAGPDSRLRTSGFMRYAQDLGWLHSTDLGFGQEWYAEHGLTWLVRAAELHIEAAPRMGSTVTARTAIVGIRRVFARRRGEFLLEDGTAAGWVHTDWVLIDRRGALTRIPEIFSEVFGGTDAMGPIGRIPLPPTPAQAVRRELAVRPHELDPLNHANNAVYLDWLEEAILTAAGPDAALATTVAVLPRRYRMVFALAAEAGDELVGDAWRDGVGWSYRLAGANDGIDRFRARLAVGAQAAVGGEGAMSDEEER
jgi:acyl-ACP thioesterase